MKTSIRHRVDAESIFAATDGDPLNARNQSEK